MSTFFLIGEGVNSLERIEFGGKIIPELKNIILNMIHSFIRSVHGQWNYEPWFSITMSQLTILLKGFYD